MISDPKNLFKYIHSISSDKCMNPDELYKSVLEYVIHQLAICLPEKHKARILEDSITTMLSLLSYETLKYVIEDALTDLTSYVDAISPKKSY